MMTHDPHHVAHLAAMLLSGRAELPERHHIKNAVSAARDLLDEASLQDTTTEAIDAPAAASEGAEKSEAGGKDSQ